jgi:hypothetical protein
MSRQMIRNILIGIIVLTIPCYICGIVILAMPSERDTPITQPTRTPIDPFQEVTNTPINPFLTPSRTPIDPFAQTPTALSFATATIGFEPIVTIQPFFTFTPIATNTPFATVTPLPSATSFPTNTPTFIPTATQEILLPATDTPNP